jgi:putative tryptophan/tyrosine transport system substrate-binding protein
LGEAGLIEGQHVEVEYRWADGQYDRLQAYAVELARLPVAILVATGGTPAALAAKAATASIPTIFSVGGDPVDLGLVESFNRPGGNITGFAVLTSLLEPKRLGLLRELAPHRQSLVVLLNPNNPPAERQVADLLQAAREIGWPIHVQRVGSDREIDAAFEAMGPQPNVAMLVAADPFFDTRREKLIALAARHRTPTMYQFREFAEAGGLISYGIDLPDVYRRIALHCGLILKGARPADLPVQQPVKFELVINLKTAKAIGIEVPLTLLAQADELID